MQPQRDLACATRRRRPRCRRRRQFGREQADHGARRAASARAMICSQHRAARRRRGCSPPRRRPGREDVRELARQFPGVEERRPVDVAHQLLERIVVEARARPGCAAPAAGTPPSRSAKRLARASASVSARRLAACGPRAARGASAYSALISRDERVARLRRHQRLARRRPRARRPSRRRPARVLRLDLHRGVRRRGRRAADQQRDRRSPARCISLRDVHHLVERRRDQARQADDVGASRARAVSRIFSHGTITPRSMTS